MPTEENPFSRVPDGLGVTIAATPWVQVLDFGLMDFVSGHHGAIPASAMRSPGQFA